MNNFKRQTKKSSKIGHLSKYVIHYADDVMIATDGTLAHHLDIVVGNVFRLPIRQF